MVSVHQLSGGGGRGLFCYHCPPSLPPHQHRLPLDYPFTPSHPLRDSRCASRLALCPVVYIQFADMTTTAAE
ncbi:hypothetical protein EVAR_76398_1 [Eumeta japonica]|uniref:Uncharacterized protein n=1 Tax=Eumeta variegata TaxID=151549 RepID=A0A4C1T818_EUMVA|nr:hypothetical protein EVAR_76398_1 [Eumeta japonica]